MNSTKTCAACLTLLLFTAVGVRAEFPFEIGGAPMLVFNTGQTEYEISGADPVVLDNGDTTLFGFRSLLEYPLDVTLIGAEVTLRPRDDTYNSHGWSFTVRFLKNLDDPDGLMFNHDWYTFPEFNFSRKFSYTESRSKIDYKQLGLEVNKNLKKGEKAAVSVIAGYEYTRYVYKMMGLTGWYWSVDNVSSSTRMVGTYEAKNHRPYVGMKMDITPSWQWLLDMKIALARVMISDLDDHVLRFKTAEANTSGWGFTLAAGARMMFSEAGQWRPFVRATGELTTQKATGDQTQRWYDKEEYWNPIDLAWVTVAEEGTIIEGIDYETKSTQFRFGLGFGLSF